MNKSVVAVFVSAAAAALFLCGCGSSKQTLRLYNWIDYVDPEIIEEFERKFDCKVVTDTFDSNESMMAKLKEGATGYDIAFPSSYMVDDMREQGFIQEIDTSRIPNLVNIDHSYDNIIADPSCRYSVPYMISNAGIAYNKNVCKDLEPTWRVFGDKRYSRSCSLLDDMRETIGAALKALGYSINSTNAAEISAAADLVIEWSKNIATFENELYTSGIANGHFVLVHGYNGDLLQIIRENDDIVFAHPKEGVSIACDEMVIMKNAKSIDLAYAFINFVHDPEIAARNMEYNCYVCPNSAAYEHLSEGFRSNESIFIPEEIRAKSEAIRDIGDFDAIYVKAWDRIKAAR